MRERGRGTKAFKRIETFRVMVTCDFNPNTWAAEAGESEFEASVIHKVSVRTARTTEKSCLEKPKRGVEGGGEGKLK